MKSSVTILLLLVGSVLGVISQNTGAMLCFSQPVGVSLHAAAQDLPCCVEPGALSSRAVAPETSHPDACIDAYLAPVQLSSQDQPTKLLLPPAAVPARLVLLAVFASLELAAMSPEPIPLWGYTAQRASAISTSVRLI